MKRFLPISVLGGVAIAACGRVDPRWYQRGIRSAEGAPADLASRLSAVKANPASPQAHLELAAAYERREDLSQATIEFRAALLFDRGNTDALLGLARIIASTGDPLSALTLARRAAELRPDDPHVLNELAIALVESGRMEEAASTFERALGVRPGDALLMLNAAAAWAGARAWARAEASCRRAAEALPSALAPPLLLAELYLQQDKPNEALAKLTALARDHPDSALVHEAAGRARLAQGEAREALEAFRRAQRLRPEWALPYLRAGHACLRLGAVADARTFFEQTLERSPRSAPARCGLAEVLLGEGDTAKALHIYEGVLEDMPQEVVALNNASCLRAENRDDLDRALRMALQAGEAEPASGSILDTLGWISFRLGRFQDALVYLNAALRRTPDKGLFHYHLGRARLAVGDRGGAVQALRAALARDLPADARRDAEALIGER